MKRVLQVCVSCIVMVVPINFYRVRSVSFKIERCSRRIFADVASAGHKGAVLSGADTEYVHEGVVVGVLSNWWENVSLILTQSSMSRNLLNVFRVRGLFGAVIHRCAHVPRRMPASEVNSSSLSRSSGDVRRVGHCGSKRREKVMTGNSLLYSLCFLPTQCV